MTMNERGYATLSASIVLSSVAVVTLALVNLSSSRIQMESRVLNQVQVDAILEGAANKVIADLINRNLSLDNLEPGMEISFARDSFAVFAEFEGDKHNLNDLDNAELKSAFSSLGLKPSAQRLLQDKLRSVRTIEQPTITSFNALREAIPDHSILNCLRTKFTIYHSPRPITASARAGRDGLEGAYLRVRTEQKSRARGLDKTVFVTGDLAAPIWIVDFRRYHPISDFKECNHATIE